MIFKLVRWKRGKTNKQLEKGIMSSSLKFDKGDAT